MNLLQLSTIMEEEIQEYVKNVIKEESYNMFIKNSAIQKGLDKNKEVQEILNLIKTEDEALCGCDWEEMYVSEYDTPKLIIDNLIEIWKHKTIMVDDEEDDNNFDGKELGTEQDRMLALAIYLKEVSNQIINEIRVV